MNGPALNPAANVTRLMQAWEWVVRLREDSASPDDLAEWLKWYQEDENNREAFEEMQSFWRESARLEESPHESFVARILEELAPTNELPESRRVDARPRRWLRPAMGVAAAACAAAVGFYWFVGRMPDGVPPPAPLAVRETRLPDGSSVELSAKSAVAVKYSAAARVLEMSGGEAYFSVAPERGRPFVVRVGNLRVRALGTAFNIRRANERITVTVTDGTVEVYEQPHSGAGEQTTLTQPAVGAVRVRSGNQLIWTENGEPTVATADTTQALAWRQGRLEYLNEPLELVIADVNRYARQPVTLGDAAVGRIIFTGTVFTQATDAWLESLPRVFPVQLQAQPDGSLLLTSKD